MWQRDIATRTHDWAIWLGAAVALHIALLAVAGTLVTPAWRSIDLVRVALVTGGGEPTGNGDRAGVGQAPEPVTAPVNAIAPAIQPHPVRKLRKMTDQKPRVPVDAADTLTQPAVEAGNAAAVATTGSGDGVGSGSGSGDGQGEGSGSGRGMGSRGDQRGYCVYCPEPGYPLVARRRGWSGRVDVELVLLADGRVDSAGVTRSSGYDVLDREALEVARRSRFRLPNPAAAPVRGHIEYRFELTQ